MDSQPTDITLSEVRHVRIPLGFLLGLVALWGGAVWSYADLRNQITDSTRLAVAVDVLVKEDHKSLAEMHDSIVELKDFAAESRRMYNRYFRDFNDPDRGAAANAVADIDRIGDGRGAAHKH